MQALSCGLKLPVRVMKDKLNSENSFTNFIEKCTASIGLELRRTHWRVCKHVLRPRVCTHWSPPPRRTCWQPSWSPTRLLCGLAHYGLWLVAGIVAVIQAESSKNCHSNCLPHSKLGGFGSRLLICTFQPLIVDRFFRLLDTSLGISLISLLLIYLVFRCVL